MNHLGRIRTCGLVGGVVSSGTGFEVSKAHAAQSPLPLLAAADVTLSAAAPASCLICSPVVMIMD